MLGINTGHVNDVAGIDIKVQASRTGLAGDPAGMGVGRLELEGVDAANYHPVQRIALPVKGVDVDVVIADHPAILVQGKHPLHGNVKGKAI